jgi:hypothetical protein
MQFVLKIRRALVGYNFTVNSRQKHKKEATKLKDASWEFFKDLVRSKS